MHGTPTSSCKKYFVTFIDDYTRYYHVYLLHWKDETMQKFKAWKSKVDFYCEIFIKCLRTDRDREYYDVIYFESIGISYEVTATYIP